MCSARPARAESGWSDAFVTALAGIADGLSSSLQQVVLWQFRAAVRVEARGTVRGQSVESVLRLG